MALPQGRIFAAAAAGLAAVLAYGTAQAQMQKVTGVSSRFEAAKREFSLAEPRLLTFTLTNTTGEAIHLLKWQTPLEGFTADILDVARDGQRVPYVGRQVKRGAPRPEDYVEIPAGQSESASVNVAEGYDVSAEGAYRVALRTQVFGVASGQTPKLAKSTSEVGVQAMESEAVTFTVVRRAGENVPAPVRPFELQMKAPVERGRMTKELTEEKAQKAPAFAACTATQQAELTLALASAVGLATESEACVRTQTVSSLPDCPRYKTWFGAPDGSRLSTVQDNHAKIASTLRDQEITFHCDCTDPYYAYVYPTNPYHVWVCSAFWTAPVAGTDSRAGTIVHEVSHFDVVADTNDYVYGQTGCKNLAINDAAKAVKNADCHEYYAENTPCQRDKGCRNCGAEHALLTLPLLLGLFAARRRFRS